MTRFSRLEKAGTLGYPTVLMKRTIAALALVIGMFPAPAVAQSSIISQIAGDKVATEKLYFSLKFGLNVAYLTGTTDTGRTGGFNVGISATIRLTDRLSLVPEITPFSRKGVSKIPFGTTGDPALDASFADPAASELALEYIDIPVLVNYRLGRIHLGAGPFVSFLGDATERFPGRPRDGRGAAFHARGHGQVQEDGLRPCPRSVLDDHQAAAGDGPRLPFPLPAGPDRRPPGTGPLAVPGPVRNSVIQAYLSFPFVH